MIVDREKVEIDRELIILSHMIMNHDVLDAASSRYAAGELKSIHFTDSYKNIFQWLIRYFEVHGKPPKKGVKDIWERKKKSFNRSKRELVEGYLEKLAENYTYYQEENIDPNYIRKEVIPDFIREREISARLDKIQQRLDSGRFDEAEDLLVNYRQVTETEEDEGLGVIMPLTREDVIESYKPENVGSDIAYEFDGDLSRIIGPLRKSWLVAITGTEKAGKSFLMDEIGYDAAIYQGRKVLKINLELSTFLQRLRTQKRVSLTCDDHQAGKIVYPVFDCENNQYGSCRIKTMRKKIARKIKRHGPLISDPNEIVTFQDRRSWTTCEYCRNNPQIRKNAADTKKFMPTIWFDHADVKPLRQRYIKRAIRKSLLQGLSNFRVKTFPRYSVTMDEVRSFIYRYVEKTDWKPDIIILDYIDIMADQHAEKRIDIDTRWKKASQIAGELDVLVLNADQATKAGRSAYMLDQMSTSESKTKDAHLDVRIALNKTDDEKAIGIARINVLFHRHMEFAIKNEVLVTQRLATSQPILDNIRIFEARKKYPVLIQN